MINNLTVKLLKCQVQEKKKKLKKEGKSTRVEEDDPEKLKHAVYVLTMKLFADLERKVTKKERNGLKLVIKKCNEFFQKRTQEQRDMEDRKRKREDEIEQEEKSKFEKEWLKNYEVTFNVIYVVIMYQIF